MVEANHPYWRGVNIRRNEIKEIYTNPRAPCARATVKKQGKSKKGGKRYIYENELKPPKTSDV